MIATTETERYVTPDRIARGAEAVERAGFVLRYEAPLGQLADIAGMRSCRALFGDGEEYDVAIRAFMCDEVLRALWPPPQDAVDDIVDRAMIDSGFLERLCAQADGDQEPTENWREALRAL